MENNNNNLTTRRTFLIWLIGGFGLLFLSLLSGLIATIRFLFPNILYESARVFKIGKPEDYTKGQPNFIEEKHIFLFNTEDGIYAISAVCTHLGCTVNWVGAEDKFRCPCHGSIFSKDGNVLKGPAPAPLVWYEVTIAKDGRLVINQDKLVDKDYRLRT